VEWCNIRNMRRYIDNSFGRSVVYTLGHIVIATLCNVYITGAVVKLALTDAVVEPLCNWVWYYVLDVMWSRYFFKKDGGGII